MHSFARFRDDFSSGFKIVIDTYHVYIQPSFCNTDHMEFHVLVLRYPRTSTALGIYCIENNKAT